MAKYSKKAQSRIEKVMHEKKKGTLRSSSGQKVKNRKQAIAIAISEARASGAKVPPEKKTAKKKTATRKAAKKKSTTKKTAKKK